MKGIFTLQLRADFSDPHAKAIQSASELSLALRQLADCLDSSVWSLGKRDAIMAMLFVPGLGSAQPRYDNVGTLTYEPEEEGKLT